MTGIYCAVAALLIIGITAVLCYLAGHDQGRTSTLRNASAEVTHLGREALRYGEDVGMPEYTPTLAWFIETYLPAHWPTRTYKQRDVSQ
jgi:hypothetical protein